MIGDFQDLYDTLRECLLGANVYEMGSWQSTTLNPEALRMREIQHVNFTLPIPHTVLALAEEIKPFLPWADHHFENERVSGMPINPGKTYKEWRYPASASQHTNFEFSHSYAERYWPQYAGHGNGGKLDFMEIVAGKIKPHRGIRHDYGDLSTVLQLLSSDPTTRQAYLPIFFPEDLVAAHKRKRIPCTLGYHFLCRDGFLDIAYFMRSCDFVRHFRDDVYLTCRLLLWVLDRLQTQPLTAEYWGGIKPGRLNMTTSSLHCFESDDLTEEAARV